MNGNKAVAFLFLMAGLMACSTENAPYIIEKAIHTHGVNQLKEAKLSFAFREYHYEMHRLGGRYRYSRWRKDNEVMVQDVLKNDGSFQRYVQGKPMALSDSLQGVFSEAVNSVFYFMQLPLLLEDQAVMKEYLGTDVVEDEPYYRIKITFREAGGGEDFQDEYRYWIHQENYTVDYLAYNYQTSGGGTRFRKAIQRKNIKDVWFQDYENYKPLEKFVSLDSLPSLFVNGKLTRVSLLENRNIQWNRIEAIP